MFTEVGLHSVSRSNFWRTVFKLGASEAITPRTDNAALSRIQARMLALLQEDRDESALLLTQRVRYASDIEDLWYLRQDLMVHLSATGGQAQAWRQVAQLHPLFEGLLPATMTRQPVFRPHRHHAMAA